MPPKKTNLAFEVALRIRRSPAEFPDIDVVDVRLEVVCHRPDGNPLVKHVGHAAGARLSRQVRKPQEVRHHVSYTTQKFTLRHLIRRPANSGQHPSRHTLHSNSPLHTQTY